MNSNDDPSPERKRPREATPDPSQRLPSPLAAKAQASVKELIRTMMEETEEGAAHSEPDPESPDTMRRMRQWRRPSG